MSRNIDSKYRAYLFEFEDFEHEGFEPESRVKTPVESDGNPASQPNLEPALVTLEIAQDGESTLAEKNGQKAHSFYVRLPNGTEHHISVRRRSERISEGTMEIAIGEGEALRMLRLPFAVLEQKANAVAFSYEGETYIFHTASSHTASSVASRSKKGVGVRETALGLLTAPMAGIVSEVLVTEGQRVVAYQPLVVLEAMKVMTTLDAPFSGIVAHLHVHPRQQIVHGAPVVEVVAP